MNGDQLDDGLVDEDDAGALFGLPELGTGGPPGSVEAGTMLALRTGADDGVVLKLDAGLAAAALSTARRLDEADRLGKRFGDLKAGYLYAQLLTPYRELMQALRLPAEVAPADEPRRPEPAADGAVPSWVHDLAGSAE